MSVKSRKSSDTSIKDDKGDISKTNIRPKSCKTKIETIDYNKSTAKTRKRPKTTGTKRDKQDDKTIASQLFSTYKTTTSIDKDATKKKIGQPAASHLVVNPDQCDTEQKTTVVNKKQETDLNNELSQLIEQEVIPRTARGCEWLPGKHGRRITYSSSVVASKLTEEGKGCHQYL